MFSLSYKVQYSDTELSTCLGDLMNTEEDDNKNHDLLSERGTILECSLRELPNYKPSKRVVIATTRSWE